MLNHSLIIAAGLAVSFHVLVLRYELVPQVTKAEPPIQPLSVQLQAAEDQQVEKQIEEPEPQPMIDPEPLLDSTIEPAINTANKIRFEPENEIASRKNENETSPTRILTVPTLSSEAFKAFTRSEAQAYADQESEAVQVFTDSFIYRPDPDYEDVEAERRPLSGMLSKVRKNNRECVVGRFQAQSFDELIGNIPMVAGTGRCRDLKPKISLVDKNGKIKNSDYLN